MGSRSITGIDRVDLVPWDARDAGHIQRMVDQRIACTWGADEVNYWSEKVIEGGKYLYWITLADGLENADELLKLHSERHDAERTPLIDSATAVGTSPRTPTNNPFIPIGHIALEAYPGRNERFGLSQTTLWVKSLYISTALQSAGLGRAAMACIENMAAQPPHNCTTLALDTVAGEYQRSERSLASFYDERGLPRPKEVRTNEDWYLRQGYVLMDLPPPLDDGKVREPEKGINATLGSYAWVNPETGEEICIPAVYMKKTIV